MKSADANRLKDDWIRCPEECNGAIVVKGEEKENGRTRWVYECEECGREWRSGWWPW